MTDGPVPGPAHVALTARLRAAGSVYAEDEATLLLEAGDGDPVRLRGLVRRRVAGEPLEYVLGWASFGGRRVRVTPGVFVPRLRTMAVVRAAASLLRPGDTVVDLCCGAGAIGLALLDAVGPLQLVAADIDPDAVEVAAENLGDHGVAVLGDLFDPLPDRLRGAVDVIAVNAPYVPTDAIALMPAEARTHEHRVALDGGADGLDLHRRIAAAAGEWLRPGSGAGTSGAGSPGAVSPGAASPLPGGAVVIEVAESQSAASAALFTAAGLEARVVSDTSVDGTVVVATRM